MSFFFPLFSSLRLKFYETTEASKNSPIIRSPIFLPYSPRILNFEIRKSGDDFFWNYHRHGHRFAKKKPMYKILILQAVISPLSRRLHFRNSNGTIKTWKKFHSSAQSSSPQFSKLFLSFLFFFLFSFFRKSAAVSAIIPKKIIAAFILLRKYECHSRATRRSKRTFPPPNLPFEAWQARRVHNLNFSRELPAKS